MRLLCWFGSDFISFSCRRRLITGFPRLFCRRCFVADVFDTAYESVYLLMLHPGEILGALHVEHILRALRTRMHVHIATRARARAEQVAAVS